VGSFYLWDEPVECVDEIFRLLRPGCSAYLYESYGDCNAEAFRQALTDNLGRVDPIRRLISGFALKKQLRMTYRTDDYARLFERSAFAGSYALERVTLAGMPIWLRIRLKKAES
jgi:hypothetical protein